MKTKNKAIYILLFFLLILFLVFNYIDPFLLWDENVYLANARSHISSTNFTEDFRFPLLEYIIAVVWFFTGESIFIAKLIMIFFTLASIYFFYLIVKEYFNKKNVLLATILFSLSPLIISWGFKVNTDIPAMLFMSISYYLIIKQIDNVEFLAGIFFALSFLTKFPFALFGIAIFIHFIIRKEFKKLLLFFSGFFLALIPWMLYNYIHYFNILWDLVIQYSVVKTYTTLEPILKQIINLFYIIGILILFIPFGISGLIKEKKNYIIIFIYCILFIIYYFFITKAKIIRYYFSILPFLYIVIYSGIMQISKRINQDSVKKIMYAIITASVILIIIPPIISITKRGFCTKDGATSNAISYMQLNKDDYTSVISNIWPYFGYYNNIKTYSLWTDNLGLQLGRYKPDYIIYHDRDGLLFNKNQLSQNNKLKLEKEIKGKCNEQIFIYKVLY